MSKILDRLQSVLRDRNITLAEFARSLMIPDSSLRNWAKAKPSAEITAKVANALGISVGWLITGEDEGVSLSSQERDLVALFRDLKDSDKESLILIADAFSTREKELKGVKKS